MLLAALLGLFGVAPEVKDEPASVTVALDEAEDPRPLPLPTVSVARGPNRPIVVIDAGHGGRDPGATSPFGGRHEKDVTLALARAMRDELVRSGRVRVALTRDDDRYIDLRDRYEIARRVGASLFVSVHADAAPNNDGARGATIYTLSEIASDREAALLAARENQAGLIGGAELSPDPGVNMILIDLALRESMDRSADFARLLHREASPFFPFREQYHRFASLIVLKAPDIPSILFEAGYLTNSDDVAYIHSAEGRQQIATGMRSAIETYFAKHNVRSAAR
ncbi:N-acetylmuramoyl-L-alanine amidase [Sphingosinicella sp. LY1275]|uniref:N-acetylmuramoyl-L-alanine amidase family protein n=1 Tax=Sphingosinicella sp. LY1275 TaxID=3095379 RepID=UPI002ADEAE40|nr:N-acetylmuramoyl-L-alanine amidase [Sphingosinicella sp. LY1275]MEA1015451.1 N-acetylmuramoyl-L-alanine amidase [Sphingosinicella sp. LY1275]